MSIACCEKRRYKLAAASYVARVADKGYLRHAALELYGYAPPGRIAVYVLAIGAESAVYGTEAAHTGIVYSLYGAEP